MACRAAVWAQPARPAAVLCGRSGAPGACPSTPSLPGPAPAPPGPQCKTRQVSLFKHGPFKNPVTLYGVTISIGTILLVTYVPFLQVRGRGAGPRAALAGGASALLASRCPPPPGRCSRPGNQPAGAAPGPRTPPWRPPHSLPPPLPRRLPQPIFTTASLNGTAWLVQLGFLAFILTYTELSKRATRRNPGGWWARRMQW